MAGGHGRPTTIKIQQSKAGPASTGITSGLCTAPAASPNPSHISNGGPRGKSSIDNINPCRPPDNMAATNDQLAPSRSQWDDVPLYYRFAPDLLMRSLFMFTFLCRPFTSWIRLIVLSGTTTGLWWDAFMSALLEEARALG
ncbi:hypothetical protein ACLOJK_015135 [Asimina triloba]